MKLYKKKAKQLAKKNEHISSDEIMQDILDTEQEIFTMKREEKGFRLVGDKMSVFKADGRRSGIAERLEFVKKLKTILKVRGALT